MKTLELELKKRLLIVEIPYGELIKNKKNSDFYYGIKCDDIETRFADQNKLKLICKGSELKEEIVREFIEYYPELLGYLDYRDNENLAYSQATESFISAIEALGYYWGGNTEMNPQKYNEALKDDRAWDKRRYSQERLYLVKIPTYKQQMKIWQEYEDKTFSPEKTLIFEILL